jgi:uncharacterized protein (TIGR02186 family)
MDSVAPAAGSSIDIVVLMSLGILTWFLSGLLGAGRGFILGPFLLMKCIDPPRRAVKAAEAVVCLALWTLSIPAEQPRISIHLDHDEIRVTAGYRGKLVRVWGEVSEDCQVVVNLSASREDVSLPLKGKRGPFWLTVGKVRFESVPSVYMLKATAPVEQILTPAQQDAHRLGVRGLTASVGVVGGGDSDLLIGELVRLKRDEGLYLFDPTGVSHPGNGRYETNFFWPVRAPPGRYTVRAFAVKDERVVASAEASVLVQKVGLEALISDLADRHGILYGLLAVLIAVATGVLAGGFLRRKA